MSRNAEYQFVPTDTSTIEALLVALCEKLTGATIQPGSPDRLLIQWVSNIIVQERVMNNYTGNQNIPSRAEGENLDALGELFLEHIRPAAKAATCQMRFSISEAQESAVLIPAGTRITDASGTLTWETVKDVYVPIGETSVETQARCQTAGVVGNGYSASQINALVDLYDYYSECTSITESDGGANEATDEEFYELMRASMDGYSCAGARGSYEYFAKQVSTEIADVVANSPTPGVVKLYVLMDDGTLATEEIKAAVLSACSADDVRPLTDKVLVEDAETVSYDISITYYTQSGGSKSAADIQAAVNEAVAEYMSWQSAKLGRDINPSYLVGLLMQTGIKRVALTEPEFTVLRDGGDAPEGAVRVPDAAAAVERLEAELSAARAAQAHLEETAFAAIAKEHAGRGDILLFQPPMKPDSIRRLADAAARTCGGLAAVFAGEDGHFAYALVRPDGGDIAPLVRELNRTLQGRGGGRNGFAQGSVQAAREEIESFFEKQGGSA